MIRNVDITRVEGEFKTALKLHFSLFLCYRKGLKGIGGLTPKNPFRREA